MIDLKEYEIWFVTGSQDLYGEETLRKVAEHSQQIAKSINISKYQSALFLNQR
jgi:L-arabinose isomerase